MSGVGKNKDLPIGLNQGTKPVVETSKQERKPEKMVKLSNVPALPFTYVAHVLEVAAAVLVLVWNIHFRGGIAWDSTNKSLIFNLHPVVMVIGFLILGSEAIMSYKGLPFSKEVNKRIHLTLHTIALVLGIWGISAAFKFHNESGIDNLYSLHSWVGLGTICLYGIQWIFGFVTFFYPGGSVALRRDALPWHGLFGVLVYILALASAELGFLEKLTFLQNSGLLKYGTEAFLVNFTALVVILLGASVVISASAPAHSEDPHSYSTISDA
ncbi:hypothetical protein J5N97_024116 [Dioscorea zingiberensis]|uniref:Cytochrome b561 domain-containing protein n=1 Tax=Dioscorea zingiberensis TaxID=325984 RepID=A0A9D5C6V5_9LILI|nr:hypothetical protein J5N97_024116 [Dioscorea zingiberensis]